MNPDQETVQLIRRLIQPIAIAESMQKMESTPFRHEHFKKTWYHGDSDTDLYIWRDDHQRVSALQFVNRDIFVDWNVHQGLRTGQLTVDSTSQTSVLDVTSAALRQNFDQQPRSDRLQFATDVLMAIPELESRDEILDILVGG